MTSQILDSPWRQKKKKKIIPLAIFEPASVHKGPCNFSPVNFSRKMWDKIVTPIQTRKVWQIFCVNGLQKILLVMFQQVWWQSTQVSHYSLHLTVFEPHIDFQMHLEWSLKISGNSNFCLRIVLTQLTLWNADNIGISCSPLWQIMFLMAWSLQWTVFKVKKTTD